jgi:hypothetical protein
MNSLTQVRTLAALLALLACGCALVKPYRYNVLWENHSGLVLKDVRISYGSFSTTFGPRLRVTEPLGRCVSVEFRTPDGKHRVNQVPIPEDIRRSIRLADLMFFIEPDLSVTVHLRTQEQRKAQVGTL